MSNFNNRNRTIRRSKSRKPSIQPLENRKLMAADWSPSITFEDGIVEVEGSWLADNVTVEIKENGTADPTDDAIQIKATNAFSHKSLTLARMDGNGQPLVDRIIFRGHGGNDVFKNMSDRPAKAFGGAGNDSLTGGTANDSLFGQDGNDWLYGREGIDQLFGGNGNDYLFGHSGNDILRGGAGEDTMFGGTGDDDMKGGRDDDRLYGSYGNDEIHGEQGNDLIRAGAGNDLIFGGSGHDKMYGDSGNDTMLGQSGEDDLYGGSGRDLIHGGDGFDVIFGGSDDDMLIGGDDTDYMYGESGSDILFGGEVDINPNAPDYDPDFVGGDTEDDDHDYLYGGTGADKFYLGDNGFFDLGTDHVEDGTAEDSIIDLDPFGADFIEVGLEDWGSYGHQAP